jgi:predicted TPR repeat methyltransferase
MNFKLYSDYYDLLYSDKDYEKESRYIIELISKQTQIEVNTILELGGGSGIHAEHFCRDGKKLYGIELSSEMVKIALNKKIKNYTIKEGTITIPHYEENKFDCAISLFHVISYLNSNSEIISCFNSVNKQLKKNALFIFDVWYTPALYTIKPETRVKRFENDQIKVTRIAESTIHSNASVVDVNYTITIHEKSTKKHQEIVEVHKMRHFTINEIELFANICGFEVVLSEEFLTKNPLSMKTWGALFVLKKI